MNDIYLLVKSLSREEKRYFKIYASRSVRGGKTFNNYVQLFNAIERQRTYDEKALKKSFKGEGWTKNFAWEKHFLYQMILFSLRDSERYSSPERKAYNMIHLAEIIKSKGLVSQAQKVLCKAKKICKQHELFLPLLIILEIERDLSGRLPLERFKEEANRKFSESFTAIGRYQNLLEYALLEKKAFLILLREGGDFKSEETIRKLKTVISHPLLQDESLSLSLQAKRYYFHTRCFYYDAKGNLEEAFLNRKKYIDWVFRPEVLAATPLGNLISILHNFLSICIYADENEDFIVYFEKFKKLVPGSEMEATAYYQSYYVFYLMFHLKRTEFEKCKILAPEIEEWLRQHENRIDKEVMFSLFILLGRMYFVTGDLASALRIVNKALQDKDRERNPDIQGQIRILNLMIHYEIGNQDLLEYLVLSVYRYLIRKQQLRHFEEIFLEFIRIELPKISSDDKLISSFRLLLAKLKEVEKNPLEKILMDELYLVTWLESKIYRRPFDMIITEKAQKERKT